MLVVTGCVAGPKGCLVKLSDAIKKPWPDLSFLAVGATEAPKAEATAA